MDRRVNTRIKIGGVIALFALLVTVLFCLSLLWFGKTVQNMEAAQSSVYLVTAEDYGTLLENAYFAPAGTGNVMGIAEYNSQLQNEILLKLMPVAGIFLIVFVVLSVGLWKVLKCLQDRRIMDTAKSLTAEGIDEHAQESHPAISSVYHVLNSKFNSLLEDNKRLYSYLSHEQKNTIAILRTNLELDGQTDYLDMIDELSNGIDDILTLSETPSSAVLTPVDVSLVCAEVYDRYRKIYEPLTFDFDGDEDTEIMSKSRWIYRAVSNLLDNAMKYGNGKDIALSVGVKNNSVIVKVQDHGIGIDAAQQEKIFQDRYRINELNKNGYGIGLSLVSYVCDLCGGFVLVESEPGEGTTFYLSFPQKAD